MRSGRESLQLKPAVRRNRDLGDNNTLLWLRACAPRYYETGVSDIALTQQGLSWGDRANKKVRWGPMIVLPVKRLVDHHGSPGQSE